VPIGRPVANTRLYLLDSGLEPVPVGVPGEICVAGIQVGRGYLHRPGLTAEKFIPDPFGANGGRLYRTGDLGRYREDGTLEFLGRTDHQVKIRGVRVEPGEIAAQLLSCPLVAQALVTVQGDGTHGKRLAAYVVCKEGCALSDAELTGQLREYLSASLPSALVPSVFVQLQAMPLGANGKIDRKALPAPNLDMQSGRTYLPPSNEAEAVLAGIWRQVLAVERVGVEDNFFDLGGHSLTAVQVMSRIRSAFGVDIPLRRVFEAPTIAQLALVVEECLIEQIEALSEEEVKALLEEGS
jgi:acyl carrier protein